MAIPVVCTKCGATFLVADDRSGAKVPCPDCKAETDANAPASASGYEPLGRGSVALDLGRPLTAGQRLAEVIQRLIFILIFPLIAAVFGCAVGLVVAAVLKETNKEDWDELTRDVGFYFLWGAVAILVVSQLYIALCAWNEGWLTFLLTLLVPPYTYWFAFSRWNESSLLHSAWGGHILGIAVLSAGISLEGSMLSIPRHWHRPPGEAPAITSAQDDSAESPPNHWPDFTRGKTGRPGVLTPTLHSVPPAVT